MISQTCYANKIFSAEMIAVITKWQFFVESQKFFGAVLEGAVGPTGTAEFDMKCF